MRLFAAKFMITVKQKVLSWSLSVQTPYAPWRRLKGIYSSLFWSLILGFAAISLSALSYIHLSSLSLPNVCQYASLSLVSFPPLLPSPLPCPSPGKIQRFWRNKYALVEGWEWILLLPLFFLFLSFPPYKESKKTILSQSPVLAAFWRERTVRRYRCVCLVILTEVTEKNAEHWVDVIKYIFSLIILTALFTEKPNLNKGIVCVLCIHLYCGCRVLESFF